MTQKNDNGNPWGNMGISSQRRVDAASPHNIFWIIDSIGKYGFLLLTNEKIIDTDNKIFLKGMTLYKRSLTPENNELFLILNNKDDWEIFHSLCHDLINVITRYNDQKKMINAVEDRMKRWQHILKHPRSAFTIEQQMGLFAELLCLKDFVMVKAGSIRDAVVSWVGADFDKQDFLMNDAVIEVKSHRTSKGEYVYISSAQQLYSEKTPFYLFSYALTNTELGQSVEDIVRNIKQTLNNYSFESIAVFEEKLLQYGYVPETIKEPLQKFLVDKIKAYEINSGFPKITSEKLPSQISSVKYSIDLSQCTEFEVKLNL